MKKNILLAIILLIVIVVIYTIMQKTNKEEGGGITIGAILPITGPTALYGEHVKKAMDLALQESNIKKVNIIYEDSQGSANGSVVAWKKLKDINHVDAMFSILSRASMPLVPISKEDKIPFLMSVVSAENAPAGSEYAFRFFVTPADTAQTHFDWIIKKQLYKKIAILAVNDEYGVSMSNAIMDLAKKNDIDVIVSEFYISNTTDMRTQLMKIKESKPDALLTVPLTPQEAVLLLKQSRDLGFNSDIIECSQQMLAVIGNASLYNSLFVDDKNLSEGVYTTTLPSVIGKTGNEFNKKFSDTYGITPIWAASFGYDVVKIFEKVVNEKNKVQKKDILQSLLNLGTIETVNGPVTVKSNREINMKLLPVQIKDKKFIEVQ